MKKLLIWLKRIVIGLAAVAIAIVPAATWLWHDRDTIEGIGLQSAEPTATGSEGVLVTWLGATTLLFDDGATQILIDGFLSRPGILDIILRRRVVSDAATIDYAMDEFHMQRLAAIIPLHSHYDHAMDVGAIANRSSASVVGTESTANIARGANVLEDQIIVATSGDTFQFGDFEITLIASRHVPNGFGDSQLFAGFMSSPLFQPATFSEWREGGSWSVLLSHPRGTTLVQGSAGFIEDALTEYHADVVMLSVAGLHRQGRQYASNYWQQLVGNTGARRVYLIHHDDFTQPFGQILLFPAAFDDVVESVQWLKEFADDGKDRIDIRLPAFGEPLVLY